MKIEKFTRPSEYLLKLCPTSKSSPERALRHQDLQPDRQEPTPRHRIRPQPHLQRRLGRRGEPQAEAAKVKVNLPESHHRELGVALATA